MKIEELEKLACSEYGVKEGIHDYDEKYYNTQNVEKANAYIKGANLILTRNKDKVFTEEDLKNFGLWLGNNLGMLKGKSIDEIFNKSPFKQKE